MPLWPDRLSHMSRPGVLTVYVTHHTQQYHTQAGFINELTRPITRQCASGHCLLHCCICPVPSAANPQSPYFAGEQPRGIGVHEPLHEPHTSCQTLQMQVAAAELRCTTSTHQCTQFQRLSEERLQQLQSAEAATADASSRAAAAVATNGDLQRQLSGALRQRDDLSRLVTERHATVTALTVCINSNPCCMQWYQPLLHAVITLQCSCQLEGVRANGKLWYCISQN